MENEIQPSIPPVQPIPHFTPPILPTTNWPIILLFIILELIIIAASVFSGIQIGKNQITNQSIEPSVIIPTQASASPSVLPTNSSDNWKIYTNSVHKYLVKYPADWIIDSSSADNIETYEDSSCCNTASLTISNGFVTWKLSINELYTGFQAPDECQDPNQCSTVDKPMKILGYQVNRMIYRLNASNKIIKAEMRTPNSHPGFGQIGFSTPNTDASRIKYFLEYSGSEIDKYIDTLDVISASLESK